MKARIDYAGGVWWVDLCMTAQHVVGVTAQIRFLRRIEATRTQDAAFRVWQSTPTA